VLSCPSLSFTGHTRPIRNEDLINLLELDGEQTVEGVFETNIARTSPPKGENGHASRTA